MKNHKIYIYLYMMLFIFNFFKNLEKLRMLKTLSLAENQIDKIGKAILWCSLQIWSVPYMIISVFISIFHINHKDSNVFFCT